MLTLSVSDPRFLSLRHSNGHEAADGNTSGCFSRKTPQLSNDFIQFRHRQTGLMGRELVTLYEKAPAPGRFLTTSENSIV